MSQVDSHSSQAAQFLIALGANAPSDVGDPIHTLNAALSRLAAFDLNLLALSDFYQTPAFPAGIGDDFVNAAAVITGPNDPERMLKVLHRVEAEFGRKRQEGQRRWEARSLDLDLLAMGAAVRPDRLVWDRWHRLAPQDQAETAPEQLILPHPRIQDRAFVLVPLADVAADWRHPILGQTVLEMRDALPNPLISEVKSLGSAAIAPCQHP